MGLASSKKGQSVWLELRSQGGEWWGAGSGVKEEAGPKAEFTCDSAVPLLEPDP